MAAIDYDTTAQYVYTVEELFTKIAREELIKTFKELKITSYKFDCANNPLAFTVDAHDNYILEQLDCMWIELTFMRAISRMDELLDYKGKRIH